MLSQKGCTLLQLFIGHTLGTADNNGSRMLNLIIEKLTEVLHIHLTFLSIYYHYRAVDMHIHRSGHIFHCLYHIRELTHSGRLNENPIRCIGIQHFLQCSSKISHQGAADTAGVHLIHLNTSILQESAVNADLTKLVFNQYNLLALEGFLQKLLN